jgi:two-component system chemotaxis response regulator CheY
VDLVVTDMNMPRMDGLKLIQAVRAHPTARLTPIVVATTESEYHRKLEGRAAGATAWIVKPFSGEQLLKVVRRLLGS